MTYYDYRTGWTSSYRVIVRVTPGTYVPYNSSNNTGNYTPVTVSLIADATSGQWFSGWACTGYLNITTLDQAGNAVATNWTEDTSKQRAMSGAGGSYTARTVTVNAYHDDNGVMQNVTVAGRYGMVDQNQSYSMPVLTVSSRNVVTTAGYVNGDDTSPYTTSVTPFSNGLITPTTPTALSVGSRTVVDHLAGTQVFTLTGSGSQSAGAVTYYYEYSTDGSTGWTSAGSSTGAKDVTLSSTQKYYFRVRAYQEDYSAYYTPGVLYTGYPPAVSSVSLSRSTTYPDGNRVTLSFTKPDTLASGTTTNSYYRAYSYSTDNGSTWSAWSSELLVSDTATNVSYTEPTTLGQTFRFYIKPVDVSGRVGAPTYSGNVYIPNLPTTPSISSLVKDVRQVSLSWSASAFDTASVNKYEISSRYSGDNGSTWSSWSVMSNSLTTTSYTTENLNIAKLYEFRVRAQSEMGYSVAYATSGQIFISAYGYRMDNVSGVPTAKAIELAARYTGSSSDSIIVGNTTYTGWKQIESMKRYTGTAFIDFIQ